MTAPTIDPAWVTAELHPVYCAYTGCAGLHRSTHTEVPGIAVNGGEPVLMVAAVMSEDGQRCLELEMTDGGLHAKPYMRVSAGNVDVLIDALVRYRDLIRTHPVMESRDVGTWFTGQAVA